MYRSARYFAARHKQARYFNGDAAAASGTGTTNGNPMIASVGRLMGR